MPEYYDVVIQNSSIILNTNGNTYDHKQKNGATKKITIEGTIDTLFDDYYVVSKDNKGKYVVSVEKVNSIPSIAPNDIFYTRYKSWERCRNAFIINKDINNPDYENLALNLAWYLASWGMLRGSSFLLQCDYSVHIVPIRDILLNDNYKDLFSIDPLEDENKEKTYLELLFGDKNIPGIVNELKEYYSACSNVIKGKNNTSDEFSDTLITKILLGVFGCIPAYDAFFMKAIGKYGLQQKFNRNGVVSLLNAFKSNNTNNTLKGSIDNLKGQFNNTYNTNIYTFMKIVDIVFWKIGEKIEELEN